LISLFLIIYTLFLSLLLALTSTVNTEFGSKVISPSTGILFNNQMDDFSIPNNTNYFGLAPGSANFPSPKKRPLSSMSPSFVFHKRYGHNAIRLIGGASGGPKIITGTVQVILNTIGKGMDLLSAIIAPRIHAQLIPDYIYVEDRVLYNNDIIKMADRVNRALTERKQTLLDYSGAMAVTQFIEIDTETGSIQAVSDPRKGGKPSTY